MHWPGVRHSLTYKNSKTTSPDSLFSRLSFDGRICTLLAARERVAERVGNGAACHWLCVHQAEEGACPQDYNDCEFRRLRDFSGLLPCLPRECWQQAFPKIGTIGCENLLLFHPVAARIAGCDRAISGSRNHLLWSERPPSRPSATGEVDVPDLAVRFCYGSHGLSDAVSVFSGRSQFDRCSRIDPRHLPVSIMNRAMNELPATNFRPTTPRASRLSRFFLSLFAITIVLCSSVVLEACPTCKEGLADNGGDMVNGYGWSIIFMMSMPFLIFTSLCSYFYYEILKARKAAESAFEIV